MSETETEKKEEKQETFLEATWDFLKTLMVSMIVVFSITTFIARPIQVIGSSMFPTLQPNAIGLANILGRRMDGLKRFDIAIIYINEKKDYLVKRVIGLPGETISYEDGVLYVNGEATEEPFFDETYRNGYAGEFMTDVSPITLGEGEYYCLGDNRPSSRDSRYYGPFRDDMIVAKGALILWPFSEFGVKSW